MAWSVLLLVLAGAPASPQTLEEVVGEYAGIRPSLHTPRAWKLSIRSDGTFRSERVNSVVFEGSVRIESGRVVLEALRSVPDLRSEVDLKRFTQELIPVMWGKRLYLVNDVPAGQFVRDVIRGNEPRLSEDGLHLLRVGDWKVHVSGRPEVPEDWRRQFPPDNFATRVARQLAYHRAEIDAGSRDGLAPGMLLNLYSPKHGVSDLRVVSVTATTAVIENPYGDAPLTKGTRVYSRIPAGLDH